VQLTRDDPRYIFLPTRLWIPRNKNLSEGLGMKRGCDEDIGQVINVNQMVKPCPTTKERKEAFCGHFKQLK
jgi:hypothetical protein